MSFPRTTDVSKHLAPRGRRTAPVPATLLLVAAAAAQQKAEAERPSLTPQDELKLAPLESGE